jgi:DNA-binding GntR family transcriptional regulator
MASPAQETAERALRVAIWRGDMPPGYRLVEAELVARTGVSRSAVRQAIDALAAEGLVERIQNKGARVRVVSTEEAVAITECRMPLEGLLARKAAERITDPEADRLRAHLRTMTAAVDSGDLLKYSELIQQLHGMVGGAARHPIAADLVGRLQAQLVRHQFRLSLRPGRPRVSLRALSELVAAIADRDPSRAEAAAVAHFRSVIAALSEPLPDPGGPA